MKVFTPLVAWHNRDRVSAVDFQPFPHPRPTKEGGTRIATGGDDNHVVIWELLTDDSGKIEPQCICDISRHQNSVNAVRWSPNGKLLASADTDSGIFIFEYSEAEAAPDIFEGAANGFGDGEEVINKENWSVVGTLRGHLQDVIGLAWSPCSKFLISCSTDNTAIVFDVAKGTKVKMLDDHKSWVNGVTWDPLNKFVATLSGDRALRVYSTKNYKCVSKTYKASLPVTVEDKETPGQFKTEERNVRMFHDDTFQSFFRRLDMSPDGELIVVPSGVLEVDGETNIRNCTYVFTRGNLTKPVLYLPGKEISIAVRFSPIKYNLRPVPRPTEEGMIVEESKPWTKYLSLFALPYRMVFAVATKNTIIFYDTQQPEPFARVSKVHYVSLNDLAWSQDGLSLIVSSTDGFCSIIKFKQGEIGTEYTSQVAENVDDSLMEMMDDDDDEINEEEEDEDDDMVPVSKEGIPLNREGVCSPAEIKIRSVKEGGKPNPKRLQLITISSPKAKVDDDIDENDLSLVLEETSPLAEEKHEKLAVTSKQTDAASSSTVDAKAKKRVPFVTLSK